MAKQPNQPSGSGRSKFRLLYIDGDLSSGDLQKLTETISGALRPATVIIKNQISDRSAETDSEDSKTEASGANDGQEPEVTNENSNEQPEASKGPPRQRKYRSPKVVNDLDMKAGGKPFVEFAKEKGNLSTQKTKFLIAAYWLAEHAKIQTISVDHVYTCYRSADWPFDVTDPTQPFRDLKADGLGDVGDGKFTINHLGISRVEKMAKDSNN